MNIVQKGNEEKNLPKTKTISFEKKGTSKLDKSELNSSARYENKPSHFAETGRDTKIRNLSTYSNDRVDSREKSKHTHQDSQSHTTQLLTKDEIAHAALKIENMVNLSNSNKLPQLVDQIQYKLDNLEPLLKQYLWNIAVNAMAAKALFQFEGESHFMREKNHNRLNQLLSNNKNTEFGKDHNFAKILNAKNPLDEFKKQVPLTEYAYYDKYIDKMANGAQNILTNEPISYFSVSSGTTGKRKLIPTTPGWTSQNLNTVFLIQGVLNRDIKGANNPHRGISLMSLAGTREETPGGVPIGDGVNVGISRMKWMMPLMYSSPLEVFENNHRPTTYFLHGLFGLQDKNLKHISSTYSTYVLELLKTIDMRREDIINTFKTGKLPSDMQLSDKERRAIESQINISPERLQMLEQEFRQNKELKMFVPKVWPNLKYIAAVGTGSFSIYRPAIDEYTGKGKIPWFNAFYGCSEANIAAGISVKNPENYALLPGSSHFEFIPEDQIHLGKSGGNQPETVEPQNLQPGKKYEVVVTNPSGFYRYRLGDVVDVKGFYHNSTPILNFAYRTGTLLNVAAEKTSEKATLSALESLNLQMGPQHKLIDFTARPDVSSSPPKYVFYLEVENASSLTKSDADRAAYLLNRELCRSNPNFKLMQDDHYVGLPVIKFVANNTFAKLADHLRGSGPIKNENRVKIPRVLNPEKSSDLIQFVERHTIQVGGTVSQLH